ncbi:Histidine kinase [Rhodovastum atsumiense]|uniref:histidine kinase n=1 Tax=Rhodovastum atsumiense TaxID=504468 RepID=A0A5M6ILS2_9PROT|nr:ATP-binding protein [Rhodovastum atsumiense]KAA5609142.1 response regulator [Rhodovastum atsumiense]CAH2601250.1 Histidine kinase [Rhodovastum atsumiense]
MSAGTDPRDRDIMQLRQQLAVVTARLAQACPMDHARQADASRHATLVAAQKAVTAAGMDLQAAMQAVVEGAVAIAPRADGAVIELREGEELVYRAACGVAAPHVGLRLRLHGALSGLSLLEGRPLLCTDTETDERVDRAACRRIGIRSMIVVPIPHRGVFVGVLKLHSAEAHGLSAADVPVAQLLVGVLTAGLSSIAEAAALDALHASEARLRLATEAAAIGTWDFNPQSRALQWDARCKALFGLPPETAVEYGTFFARLHPDDRATVRRAMEAALDPAGAGEYGIEFRTIAPLDGTERWVAAKGRAFFEGDGPARRPIRLIGTVLDITDRRHAEENLRRLNTSLEARVEERTAALARAAAERQAAEEQLRQAQKMQALGQLTGGIAHDFNNLLLVITGSAELLRRPQVAEQTRQTLADAIARAAGRAATLTAQLLAFARRQPLMPEVFDLNARMRETTAMLQRLLGAPYRVETDLAGDLWAVQADPNQLEVALVNIGVNARDAMPDGGTLRITTRNVVLPAEGERPAGDYVCLSVQDTGTGIAAELLGRVFEPFFTTKETGRGTGLGLSQVWGFAAQSGGGVRIESRPGHGTTVILQLPRARRAVETATEDAAPPLVSGEGTILLVEDNPQVAELGQMLLEELGYKVVNAGSGERALDLLAGTAGIDLVFSDIVMPGMSGIELAREVRRMHPELPVVLATGYSDVAAREGTGEIPILAKPYRLETLAGTLQRAFAARPSGPLSR